VTRTVLTAEQVDAIAEKLKEPYATLVLFLAATDCGSVRRSQSSGRISEAMYSTRRIYEGDVDAVKSKRSEHKLPIDPILMARMEKLGKASGSSVPVRAHP